MEKKKKIQNKKKTVNRGKQKRWRSEGVGFRRGGHVRRESPFLRTEFLTYKNFPFCTKMFDRTPAKILSAGFDQRQQPSSSGS